MTSNGTVITIRIVVTILGSELIVKVRTKSITIRVAEKVCKGGKITGIGHSN